VLDRLVFWTHGVMRQGCVGQVSDSVTRRIGAANVGLRYLATLNKLTRHGLLTSRMGRAARNPSHKESIMMGFGYRLYPSYALQLLN